MLIFNTLGFICFGMDSFMKVLIVEDADFMRQSLVEGLTDCGYTVDAAVDGEEGYWFAADRHYDLILLDVMLPQMTGFSLLEKLRAEGNDTLVLLLTARDAVSDRVKGLRYGADDYLVKPFDFEELLARMEALLRRRNNLSSHQLHIDQLMIDFDRKEVKLSGESIELPRREYNLLECLALNRDQVVSREDIENKIYDDLIEPMSNVVDSAISSLRKKIDKHQQQSFIITRRGYGYQLRTPE